MTDEWTKATWGDVAKGDFVRKGLVYRVDGLADNGEGGLLATLYRPEGAQEGTVKAKSSIEIRTRKAGKLTDAGQRFRGLSPEGKNALEKQLGAELIAVQSTMGAGFQPWILTSKYTTVSLANHLFMFHELDGSELRAAHKAFHAADPIYMTATARRVPHIHNEEAFKREA